MTETAYDVVVIGAGPGGYVAALKAAQLGARVAVVEKSHLGGTCLNNGCIPSKALLATGEALHTIQHAADLGIAVDGRATADWGKVQKRKDGVLRRLRGGIKALFKGRRVTHVAGAARFDGIGRIVVDGEGGEPTILTAPKIIVAAGSTPGRIPGWPTDPELVCTSDEALHWQSLPARLLIVGGGVIGCEFACMMQAFGVTVTVVEMMPRLLPEMDEELAAGIAQVFKQRDIVCFTDTKVDDLAVVDGAIRATLSGGKSIDADRVLVAVGRRPATNQLALDRVGLNTERGFLRVNDAMQTANAEIYCIGDANGRCLLAHAASAQGVVAAANALGAGQELKAPVPWCVYTFPEIAGVGMTQQQAREHGLPIAVGRFPLGHLGKAMAAGHPEGFVKVIRHRESDAVLGVHLFGHNATEMVAAATVAVDRGVSVHELADVVFAHPTLSEAIKEASEDALGMALHLPPRKVLRLPVGN